MKTQRLEYLDTLNILFSGKSAIKPPAAEIIKILAPLQDDSIDSDLEEANAPCLFSDSNTKENHRHEKSPSITQNTTEEKPALLAKSNCQAKKRVAKKVDSCHGKDNSRNDKKAKKLIGGEQILCEMSQWTTQNAASLEARHIEKLKLEARVMEDQNASYAKELGELNLSEFTSLVMTLKTINSIYANGSVAEYYLMFELDVMPKS